MSRAPYCIQSDLIGARFGEFYVKRSGQSPSRWVANPTEATYFQTKADADKEIARAFPSHPECYLVLPVDAAYALHCQKLQKASLPELSLEAGGVAA